MTGLSLSTTTPCVTGAACRTFCILKLALGPYYRPVQGLLYFLIYQCFGLSEPAFHAASVMLQAANACLMYKLGCRLGFYPRASFVAALLWGIHPLWVEAVAVVVIVAGSAGGVFNPDGGAAGPATWL